MNTAVFKNTKRHHVKWLKSKGDEWNYNIIFIIPVNLFQYVKCISEIYKKKP